MISHRGSLSAVFKPDRVLYGEQLYCSPNSEWCLQLHPQITQIRWINLCNLWIEKNFVDSLKLICYVAPNSKFKRSGRQWQPKKEPRSPEARAKVPVREQKRARRNRSPEVALRSM